MAGNIHIERERETEEGGKETGNNKSLIEEVTVQICTVLLSLQFI